MTLRADNRLADAPMTAVQCQHCATQVLVRKSSWNQTSVQWNAAASAGCIERSSAERLAAYGGHGLFLACSELGASIADAVRRGVLPVVEERLPGSRA
jgi:hypothetical protein